MALFSYDPSLASDLDWIRLLVGDVRQANPEMDDLEIQAVLDDTPKPDPDFGTDNEWRAYRYQVAAKVAELIAGKHALDSDLTFEGQRVGLSAKYAQYTALAKRLRGVANSYAVVKTERW
jgi:hypothetical protein